jgi:hypothetical protein
MEANIVRGVYRTSDQGFEEVLNKIVKHVEDVPKDLQ